MNNALKVDIWSDVACPWCYIGKRRFEAGVAEFGGEVDVEYHSFELAPDMPADFEGTAADSLARRKGVSSDQIAEMFGRVSGIAKEAGLNFDYDAVKPTNTIPAHELLHFAKANGRQVEMKERLLRAYFVEGRNVGHIDELAELAAEVGLDGTEARRSLTEHEYLADVETDKAMAMEYGIQGVPFFVIDGKYGISGAQEASTFAAALHQARDEKARETQEHAV